MRVCQSRGRKGEYLKDLLPASQHEKEIVKKNVMAGKKTNRGPATARQYRSLGSGAQGEKRGGPVGRGLSRPCPAIWGGASEWE